MKGSKFYKQALKELLVLPDCVTALMHIVKINLRAFFRRE